LNPNKSPFNANYRHSLKNVPRGTFPNAPASDSRNPQLFHVEQNVPQTANHQPVPEMFHVEQSLSSAKSSPISALHFHRHPQAAKKQFRPFLSL
jgi:hypothetical protein